MSFSKNISQIGIHSLTVQSILDQSSAQNKRMNRLLYRAWSSSHLALPHLCRSPAWHATDTTWSVSVFPWIRAGMYLKSPWSLSHGNGKGCIDGHFMYAASGEILTGDESHVPTTFWNVKKKCIYNCIMIQWIDLGPGRHHRGGWHVVWRQSFWEAGWTSKGELSIVQCVCVALFQSFNSK